MKHTESPCKKTRSTQNISSQYGARDEPAYTLCQKRERTYAKNGAIDKTFQVKFTNQLQNKKMTEITDDLHTMFDDILNRIREGSQGDSLGRVIIEHNGLTDRTPLWYLCKN